MDDESACSDSRMRHSAVFLAPTTAPVSEYSMPHTHATSDAKDALKSIIGPLKITHAAMKNPRIHVASDPHKPKAWPRPTNGAMSAKETWPTHSAHGQDEQPVEATLPPMDIATKPTKKKLDVQVVIDYVGHGVASDPPVLTPQLAALEDSLTSVQSSEYAAKYQWKHDDSAELAIVGAIVLVVAMVVIVFARRQQRAFEAQQRALEASAQELEGDLENGATTAQEAQDDGVGTPESETDPTVESPHEKADCDEAVKSPESVVEGCV